MTKQISVFITLLAESESSNGWVTKEIYFALIPADQHITH